MVTGIGLWWPFDLVKVTSWHHQLTVIIGIVLIVIPVHGFNLEPRSTKIFLDPSQAIRPSYFGFSVALLNDDASWLIVGAPRANSSNPRHVSTHVIEPGVIFKCNLKSNVDVCEELVVDPTGNDEHIAGYHDLKNNGWLGASLDSQPTRQDNRQVTATCAPRWINQAYYGSDTYLMNGACYWLNSSLTGGTAHKKLPLINIPDQTFPYGPQNFFYYAYGQAGMSLHFPDDQTEMIIGAPGVFNWQGTVIRLKDRTSPIPEEINYRRRRRRQLRRSGEEALMFVDPIVPNPHYTTALKDFDLNGYSVTSGRFLDKEELLYASGAPRGADTLGKVYVFEFPAYSAGEFNIRKEWQGSQIGENFGASLASADVNGDGLSDLIVGAPMYFKHPETDMGRIQVFLSTKSKSLLTSGSYSGSNKANARFGTTISSIGDLNKDGYDDIAVGAPWEDDGQGAVYIYMGSENGLRQKYAQRLSPSDFPGQNLKGFGMGISRGIDIDGNNYSDLAIGSFLSGHSVVLRSRPVGIIKGHLKSRPSSLDLDDTSLTLEACIFYTGKGVPNKINVEGNITLDYGHPSPRASFTSSGLNTRIFKSMAAKDENRCFDSTVYVKANKIDPRRPIVVKIEYEIPESSGDIITQPITDPDDPMAASLPIGIVTGCEEDGDKTCEIDMHVEVDFVGYRPSNKLTIGGDVKPKLAVEVSNLGESVFLPNVTITVEEPFALLMPTTHSCDFLDLNSRTELVCKLTNPIKLGHSDKVNVEIDASGVKDDSNELSIDVNVAGEGIELTPTDNLLTEKLELLANADVKLHGYSRNEQLVYQRIGEDQINTTFVETSFTHFYHVVKSGPTPIGRIELEIDIPVNFTENINFINVYAPQTDFNGQPFLCSISGIAYTVESKGGDVDENSIAFLNITNNVVPPSRKDEEDPATKIGISSNERNNGIMLDDSSLYEERKITCPSEGVSCAKLKCSINSWDGGTSQARVEFKMDVHSALLASQISARGGAKISSTATASIVSLATGLEFVGNKVHQVSVDTIFLPDSLPGRGVPWWIILLAILGGLLLLGLLCYGLYKMGFFKRKEQDEMKAHLAESETGEKANYGT